MRGRNPSNPEIKKESSNKDIKKRLENAQAPEQDDQLAKLLARRRLANNEAVETAHTNAQPSDRQKELAEIAAARQQANIIEQNQPTEVTDQVVKSHSVAQEFKSFVSVSSLKDKLANKIPLGVQSTQETKETQANTQKSIVAAEVAELRKVSSVREKTKVIEELLVGTNKVIQAVKVNEVSTKAKIELTVNTDLKIFEEVQETMIMHLQEKLNIDFKEYETVKQKTQMSKDEFFELSIKFRTYQVCLEQDVLRHAADKVGVNSGVTPSAPTKLAIQSLNYYEDFFRKLTDIEKIWPDAGKLIRTAEIATMYVTAFYDNKKILAGMLNHNEAAIKEFHIDLDLFIQKNVLMTTYIQSGNGLDAKQHPWTLNKCSRLPQANSSIKFNEIVAIDEVHKNILHDVDKRVEHDANMRVGFNK